MVGIFGLLRRTIRQIMINELDALQYIFHALPNNYIKIKLNFICSIYYNGTIQQPFVRLECFGKYLFKLFAICH